MFWYAYFYQAKPFKQSLKECFTNGGFVVLFVMWTISVVMAISWEINKPEILVGYVTFLCVLYFGALGYDRVKEIIKGEKNGPPGAG